MRGMWSSRALNALEPDSNHRRRTRERRWVSERHQRKYPPPCRDTFSLPVLRRRGLGRTSAKLSLPSITVLAIFAKSADLEML